MAASNITGKAGALSGRAAKLGGQVGHKATEVVGVLAEKAGPLAQQAREKAGPLARQAREKAGPLARQAREKGGALARKAGPVAAHGVGATAGRLDRLTHGKYSQRIKSVRTRLEHLLDGRPNASAERRPES